MSLSQPIIFAVANALLCAANLAVAVTTGYSVNVLAAMFCGLCLADCVRALTDHARDPLTEEMR